MLSKTLTKQSFVHELPRALLEYVATRVMRGSRKFCHGGPTLTLCFLVDEGRDLNGVCWLAEVGPTLNAGLAVLCFS